MEISKVNESSKEIKNLKMSVRSGSRRKQRLSNSVSLTRTLDGGVVSVSLTMREAKALRKFLNESLD